jgi:uncharacterized protein YjbI with pentapeptide repeats
LPWVAVTFRGTNLSPSDLSDTFFIDADLTGADLRSADLTGVRHGIVAVGAE